MYSAEHGTSFACETNGPSRWPGHRPGHLVERIGGDPKRSARSSPGRAIRSVASHRFSAAFDFEVNRVDILRHRSYVVAIRQFAAQPFPRLRCRRLP